MFRLRSACTFAALAASMTLAGCHVNTQKGENGKDNVDIGTPFGSLQVKTDDKATGGKTGLTPYPGATMVKKNNDSNGAADISLNFGDFKLGVHAVDLQTQDPEDKVLAFYKKDMGHYGAVLTCRGKNPVGTPVRTGDGLTCSSDQHQVNFSDNDHLELRAGSETHQHIVGIHTESGATHIGLVALDLPSGLHHHDDSDRE